ncbi:cation:proton antiporter [Pontiella sp.]|uniref:cation:proton antiporter n=1 Tax=Pontiella sp. TaxID=2837462 RepID=UPI00356A3118
MSAPAAQHAAETATALPYLFTLVGAMLIICFYAGKLIRKTSLPSLIGYMLIGALFGPSFAKFGLQLFTEPVLHSLSFITQVALGFVAFSIGSELSMKSLKRLGSGIVWIIFAESFTAFFVVTGLIYAATQDLPMALIFGSMAPASAPAGTVAIIQEYKASGSLTQALYAVVGFDDGLAIIIFGFAAALAKSLLQAEMPGHVSEGFFAMLKAPTLEIIFSIIVGTVLGFLLAQLVRFVKHSRDMLIVVFGFVTLGTGLSMLWHLSLILTNMVIGFVLVNTRRESLVHKVTAPLLEIMPLTFVLFFCLAGAHLQLNALPSLGIIGLVYILGRSAGLIGGARLGAIFGHVDEKIKKYVGLGILSQAGVAIGLALIVNAEFAGLGAVIDGKAHGSLIGAKVITTITATCIVFEIVGPVLAKYALGKAGELGKATR